MITIRARINYFRKEDKYLIGEIYEGDPFSKAYRCGFLTMTNDAWEILIEALSNYAACIPDEFTFIEEK